MGTKTKAKTKGATPARLVTLAPGVSLKRLAKTSGIALPHLSRIFSGKRGLTVDKAVRIATALDVPLSSVVRVLVLERAA